MAIEFTKLSEVEQVETASENASVLIEEGGDIKRVLASAVGGGGGGETVFLPSFPMDGDQWTEEQFAEYYELFKSGKRLVYDNGQSINPVLGFTYSYGIYTMYMFNSYAGQVWQIYSNNDEGTGPVQYTASLSFR